MKLKIYLLAFLLQFSIVQMTGQEDSVNFETILSKKTLDDWTRRFCKL